MPDELLELLRKYPRDQRANDARLHGLVEGWLQRHNLFRELSVLTGGMATDLREGQYVASNVLTPVPGPDGPSAR